MEAFGTFSLLLLSLPLTFLFSEYNWDGSFLLLSISGGRGSAVLRHEFQLLLALLPGSSFEDSPFFVCMFLDKHIGSIDSEDHLEVYFVDVPFLSSFPVDSACPVLLSIVISWPDYLLDVLLAHLWQKLF